MAIYDLYGCVRADLEEAKNILESALDIKFEIRNSDYQGGDYLRSGKTTDEHFVLKRNLDSFDDGPAEILFAEYPILFYVNGTSRSLDLQQKLVQKEKIFVLLKHELSIENESQNS